MICIHHNDNDGFCSAAIVSKYYKNKKIRFIEMAIYDTLDFSLIHEDELVIIVDYSFNNKNFIKLLSITKNIIWIDHHKSAINDIDKEIVDQLKGIQQIGKSAALLCWEYFFKNVEVPLSIKLINDYDIWAFKYKETRNFHTGLLTLKDIKQPDSNVWKLLLKDDDYINKFVEIGKTINVYIVKEEHLKIEKLGFIKPFEDHIALCVNTYLHFNDLCWEHISNYDTPFDILIMYQYNGKYWNYSLRSEKVDVSKICKKYNGGGHKGSAGFSSKEFLLG